jgi:DNA-binding transcriptional ArsR family regulator
MRITNSVFFGRLVVSRSVNVESARPRAELISPQLAAAMSHPTRVLAMTVLNERTASPRQIATEIGEPLNNVTYHVNQLRDLGCIELVRTEAARGGRVLERFYRAAQRIYFDEDSWNVLSERERLGVTGVAMKIVAKDLAVSMASGAFSSADGAHVSRSVPQVDSEGWQELIELAERNNQEIIRIEERVAERASQQGSVPSIDARVVTLQFRGSRDADAKG